MDNLLLLRNMFCIDIWQTKLVPCARPIFLQELTRLLLRDALRKLEQSHGAFIRIARGSRTAHV